MANKYRELFQNLFIDKYFIFFNEFYFLKIFSF